MLVLFYYEARMTANPQRIGDLIKCSVAGEEYFSYLPKALPPAPEIEMDKIYPLLERANIALGRLDGLSLILPDISLFLYMYVRKEAVLSSQIEGTQSSLSDLLLYEQDEGTSISHLDVIEVSNYVAAMEHGLKRIEGGFPLSMRLIKEMHEILLNGSRGSSKQPGEFRRSQNWIGGTRPGNAKFVPPSPDKVIDLLSDLEKFLHDDQIHFSALIKAALAHHQFETIHPFLDGNGRLGRLLITFILCVEGVLQKPLLYLSLFFKANRQAYYDHLQHVRETGDWEEWIRFFLIGVIETTDEAINAAQRILQLFDEDRKKIVAFDKSSLSLLLVYNYLQKYPITNAKKIMEECNITLPTVGKTIQYLVDLRIIEETTGKARNRIYAYRKYLNILSEGAEAI